MNILIINRKGGAGKTLLCDEIMFSLERSHIPAAYIDLDDQGSSIHSDSSDSAESADVSVIDMPGALSEDLPQWLESADVVVIPTNPSARDIPMMLSALDSAKEYAPNAPRIIVVNRFNRYRAATQFMDALKEVKDRGDTITTLPQSESFQNAFLDEVSVIESAPRSAAALRTLQTVNEIRRAANLPPDPTNPEPIVDYLKRQQELAQIRREIRNG